MSGPAVVLWLRAPLSPEERRQLPMWIGEASEIAEVTGVAWDGNGCDLRLAPVAAAGRPPGRTQPFFLEIDSADVGPIEGLTSAAPRLGFTPAQTLLVVALAGGDVDHRLLACAALALLERLGGVVALDGDLDAYLRARRLPPAPRSPGLRFRFEPDATDVVDATWLRAWLQDPHFRLIK